MFYFIHSAETTSDGGAATLKVRPSKIVAGHEPERTNELLQAIGLALDNQANATSNNSGGSKKTVAAAAKPKATATRPTKTTSESKSSNNINNNATSSGGSMKSKSNLEATSKKKHQPVQKNAATAETKESSVRRAKGEKSTTSIKTKESKPKTISKSKSKDVEDIIPKTTTEPKEIESIVVDSNSHHDATLETPATVLTADQIMGAEIREEAEPQREESIHFNNEEDTNSEAPFSTSPNELPTVIPFNNITNNNSSSTIIQPSSHKPDAELIDVIDQEAELRRRERFERKRMAKAQQASQLPAEIDTTTNGAERPETRRSATKSSKNRRNVSNSNNLASSNVSMDEEQPHEPAVLDAEPTGNSTVVTTIPSAAAVPTEKPVATMPPSRPRTSLRPPSVRPASARPGAPRRRERNVEVILPPNETQFDASNIARNGSTTDTTAFGIDLDEDADNLIVIEDAANTAAGSETNVLAATDSGDAMEHGGGDDGDLGQGHLVQQILQTQKVLVKATGDADDGQAEPVSDFTCLRYNIYYMPYSMVSQFHVSQDFSTLQKRQSSAKQMDTLRDSIQQLTRSVNPLGKLMDFLQEDIDAMQMELTAWRNSYSTAKTELSRERRSE